LCRSEKAAGLTGLANPLTIEENALCPQTLLRGPLLFPQERFLATKRLATGKDMAGIEAQAFWKADP